MENLKKYTKVFMDVFGVSEEETKGMEYQSIQSWDSVGHMNLIEALEDEFDIMIDTEDIVALESFEKGLEILKKYGVEIG